MIFNKVFKLLSATSVSLAMATHPNQVDLCVHLGSLVYPKYTGEEDWCSIDDVKGKVTCDFYLQQAGREFYRAGLHRCRQQSHIGDPGHKMWREHRVCRQRIDRAMVHLERL